MAFEDTPRYRKLIQRMRRMGPEQQAIFSTVAADSAFADEEMRKRLEGMRRKAFWEDRDRNFGLREKQFALSKNQSDTNTAIRRDQMKTAQEDEKFGTYLSLAGLPLAYAQNQEANKRHAELLKLIGQRG